MSIALQLNRLFLIARKHTLQNRLFTCMRYWNEFGMLQAQMELRMIDAQLNSPLLKPRPLKPHQGNRLSLFI